MTGDDLAYVTRLLAEGHIRGPVLELGAGYEGLTCRSLLQAAGLTYVSTDIAAAPGVDIAANFETGEGLSETAAAGPFGTVLVLNVLEHTLEPLKVLDNAVSVARVPDGRVVALTPAVWPLHNYPMDCYRLLPDWYRHYARTRQLKLVETGFEYVGFGPVAEFRTPQGPEAFPPPGMRRPAHRVYSRVVHRLFNTYGRGMAQPSHLAIAAIFVRG